MTIMIVQTCYKCPGNICSPPLPPAPKLDQKDLDFT